MPPTPAERLRLEVVLFSGGRGSGALAELLVTDPRIALTVAINGYDDGASTGEVRRFLGDALGPSDFRKNASRLARLLEYLSGAAHRPARSAARSGVCRTRATASGVARVVRNPAADPDARLEPLRAKAETLPPGLRRAVADRLDRFAEAIAASAAPFSFSRLPASATSCSPAASCVPAALQRGGRRLLRAPRPARRAHRQRHRRHERLPGRASTTTAGCSAARRRSSTRSGRTASSEIFLIGPALGARRPGSAGARHAAEELESR